MNEEFEIRKNELNSNRIFNDTDFVIESSQLKIETPSLKNKDVVCSSNQEEFFLNCFSVMGKGRAGTFYSPEINKKFGIRKLSTRNMSAVLNEISILKFFREHFDEFPFVAHIYGWTKYIDNVYIIVEHKDTDLTNVLSKLSKTNDDITDEFMNIFKIIVAQLQVFGKYNIYHQDLHTGNILIKEYDSPIHITWNGLDIHTKYVPYIHDFDLVGVRGETNLKKLNNVLFNNIYWLEFFFLRMVQETERNLNYYKKCYDTYQIFNSMVHFTISQKDKLNNEYNISIDLVRIFRELFNQEINDNDFTSLIMMSIFNSDNYKIINKKDNVEYKMVLNVKGCYSNINLLNKTPVIFYSQLNPFFELFDILCEIYDVDNINIF